MFPLEEQANGLTWMYDRGGARGSAGRRLKIPVQVVMRISSQLENTGARSAGPAQALSLKPEAPVFVEDQGWMDPEEITAITHSGLYCRIGLRICKSAQVILFCLCTLVLDFTSNSGMTTPADVLYSFHEPSHDIRGQGQM